MLRFEFVTEGADTGQLVVMTSGVSATTVILLSFIFIAYILQPLIERVHEQIRASHGEQDIELNRYVEVTPMNLPAEILRGRGKHGGRSAASRIVAVLVALFVIACFVLELQLDLKYVEDGPVYLFDRPPPVFAEYDAANWTVVQEAEVTAKSKFLRIDDGDENKGSALSSYRVPQNSTDKGKTYEGKISTAFWSNIHPREETNDHKTKGVKLFFKNATVTLEDSLECSNVTGTVQKQSDTGSPDPWGRYTACGEGPRRSGSAGDDVSPPTIILEGKNGEAWLIMEEKSTNPSFLYSVWKTTGGSAVGSSGHAQVDPVVELVFYIASTTRMVEAIITGIVHGYETGGECVGILWAYSAKHWEYDYGVRRRASPFGESPADSTVNEVSEVESIEQGVKVDHLALACFLWLLLMTLMGVGWAWRSRSRAASRDIFDLAEVIKLVVASAPGSGVDPDSDSAVRIFLHKEDGEFVVTLEETEDIFSLLALCRSGVGLLQRLAVRIGCCTRPSPFNGVDDYGGDTGVHDPSTTPLPVEPEQEPEAEPATVNRFNNPTALPPRTPARDIENNQGHARSEALSSAARLPATTPPGTAAPPVGPNQQYRLCVQRRFGLERSFSDAPRRYGPAWSLTASPVSSAALSPNPTPLMDKDAQHASGRQTVSQRMKEGMHHLEVESSSRGITSSSTTSPSPVTIPMAPAFGGAGLAAHPEEAGSDVGQPSPAAGRAFGTSDSAGAIVDKSSGAAAERTIAPPSDSASASSSRNNTPVLASVYARREAEALEAQNDHRAAVAAVRRGGQSGVSAQSGPDSGISANRPVNRKTRQIAPRSHPPAEPQARATAVISGDSPVIPASGASGGCPSPAPSRRTLEAEPTLGPAGFDRLNDASHDTDQNDASHNDTGRGNGRQPPIRQQSSRKWWWKWGKS